MLVTFDAVKAYSSFTMALAVIAVLFGPNKGTNLMILLFFFGPLFLRLWGIV